MNFPFCSLIISTYNRPDALLLCLESIRLQTILPNEIIIADDGSDFKTKMMIDEFAKGFPVPIVHVWHADEGFRLAQIRNKAIAAAHFPYIIQIDGDLMLERHFVEDHLSFAKKNYFVRGSRSMLSEAVTKDVLCGNRVPPIQYLKKHCTNKLNSRRNRLVAHFMRHKYQVSGKNYYKVIGCNMAFWKKDLMRVNGYNEEIVGWGPEDLELSVRLLKSGIKKQALKMAGVTFHLYHKENSRANKEVHKKIIEKTLANKNYVIECGIGKYLPESIYRKNILVKPFVPVKEMKGLYASGVSIGK